MISDHADAAWLNGRRQRSQLMFSRGLHYGDGVFRTILKIENKIIFLEEQLNKLHDDCARLQLVPDMSHLRRQLLGAGRGRAAAVLKLLVTRASTGRGYAPLTDQVDVMAFRWPLPSYPAACWTEGVAAITSDVQLGSQPRLAGIKHLSRLEQILASRDWPDGVRESILTDEASNPICGTRSNLFWVRAGQLHTPDLSRCGVSGIMRQRILEAADGAGIQCRIDDFSQDQLRTAEEAFVCNSLIGIWPLRQLDHECWAAPGPITLTLMQLLNHPRLT